MRVRRVAIENVRSFLDRAELRLDGPISILIGPNGGGKTNLLDTMVIVLRRYLFASMYAMPSPTAEQPDRYEFRHNDQLNNMVLDRHSAGAAREQVVEIELEVTERDIQNMAAMKSDGPRLRDLARRRFHNLNIQNAEQWDLSQIGVGQRFIYRIQQGRVLHEGTATGHFLQYLQLFEIDALLREAYDFTPLTMPMIYLTVNRSTSGFQASVQLANYNDYEQKRQLDAAFSRSGGSIVQLAIGRLAQKFRLLLEEDKGVASKKFRDDPNLKQLTSLLAELGYDWTLQSIDPLKNIYDVKLKKQGSSFLVGAASSGERELLTYLFAIFALNVRDALIIVDEPELHLHPKWQKTLLQLFVRLAGSTGNQFLLATHAPTFVSPQSIQYVSRVFSQSQKSHITRLNVANLPENKHLFNIINSQNNERLFFADEVVLVEGLSDRIFFEKMFDKQRTSETAKSVLEVVSVGGKYLFPAYQKILDACQVRYSIIADLDYLDQIGTEEIRTLLRLDEAKIKHDVIDNEKSMDAAALVAAIDKAIETSSWGDAKDVWNYIKGRRLKLRSNLTPEERGQIDTFIESKRSEKTYVLRRGALEAYLPDGAKDMERLIAFLATDDFWNQMSEEARNEIASIVDSIVANVIAVTSTSEDAQQLELVTA